MIVYGGHHRNQSVGDIYNCRHRAGHASWLGGLRHGHRFWRPHRQAASMVYMGGRACRWPNGDDSDASLEGAWSARWSPSSLMIALRAGRHVWRHLHRHRGRRGRRLRWRCIIALLRRASSTGQIVLEHPHRHRLCHRVAGQLPHRLRRPCSAAFWPCPGMPQFLHGADWVTPSFGPFTLMTGLWRCIIAVVLFLGTALDSTSIGADRRCRCSLPIFKHPGHADLVWVGIITMIAVESGPASPRPSGSRALSWSRPR